MLLFLARDLQESLKGFRLDAEGTEVVKFINLALPRLAVSEPPGGAKSQQTAFSSRNLCHRLSAFKLVSAVQGFAGSPFLLAYGKESFNTLATPNLFALPRQRWQAFYRQ